MLTTAPLPLATLAPPQPDKDQLATFIRTIFRHASPEFWVSLRAFNRDDGTPIYHPRPFDIDTDQFKWLIKGAVHAARDAAKAGGVFSPPIATFKTNKNAKEENLAEGLTISIECDELPSAALATLSAHLGAPTLVVESGGRWADPQTGETEPKLHLHWVLKVPARDPEGLKLLKQARAFATAIVGADPTCVPIVHPMRWPGSWHLKDPNNPRLCQIVEESENEIDLNTVYDVLRDAAPAEAVNKATRLRHAREPAKPRNTWQEFAARSERSLADIRTLTEAMAFVTNDDLHWNDRNNIGLALSAATANSDAGFELFAAFSKKSKKYDPVETRDRWAHYKTSPPDRTGANKIYAIAIENGWERTAPFKMQSDTETKTTITMPEARAALQHDVVRFVNYDKREKNWAEIFAEEATGRPCVRTVGLPVEVGVGKTRAAIKAIIESKRRFLYTVPTIKPGGVSDEIRQELAEAGVDVEIFRGRGADDPDHPNFILTDDREHKNPKMCRDPESVADAIEAMQNVQTTVCKSGDHECSFYSRCSYQKQLKKKPRVWIAASDVLFYRHRVFRDVNMLMLDEGFFEKAIRGIESRHVKLPIKILTESRIVSRVLLGRHLLEQDDGGVKRETIEGGNPDDPMLDLDFLHRLKVDEWERYKKLSKELGLLPGRGLSAAEKKAKSKLIRQIRETRHIITFVTEIENMYDPPLIETSGRLQIKTIDDVRQITWRGLARISKQFHHKQVLYLDATMPSKEILKQIFPAMEIKTSLPVAVPDEVYTLQVRKAPTSAEKLIHGEHVEGHREEMRLCILQYWMEFKCQPTVVIAQKPVADWLRAQKLPENIRVEHYNAVAGIDRHKDVRLQILIGRTQPGPEVCEAQAATVSGEMPDIIESNDGEFSWFGREPVGINLRNGRQRMVQVDRHPDPLCEAHRYQITECEQIQAFGRARPLNRDGRSPLTIVLLFDNVLPTVVDKVVKWNAPSRFIATAYSDGMMLLSPVDIRRIWPTIWGSLITARRDVAQGVPTLPGFVKLTYRPKAPKAKKRVGYFHTFLCPDPARALEERLGIPVEVAP